MLKITKQLPRKIIIQVNEYEYHAGILPLSAPVMVLSCILTYQSVVSRGLHRQFSNPYTYIKESREDNIYRTGFYD